MAAGLIDVVQGDTAAGKSQQQEKTLCLEITKFTLPTVTETCWWKWACCNCCSFWSQHESICWEECTEGSARQWQFGISFEFVLKCMLKKSQSSQNAQTAPGGKWKLCIGLRCSSLYLNCKMIASSSSICMPLHCSKSATWSLTLRTISKFLQLHSRFSDEAAGRDGDALPFKDWHLSHQQF